MQGLASYIVRRLLCAPVILLAVSLATFALGRFGPGDPIQILQGQYRDPVQRERIAQELGYHDSFFTQYWRYMEGAVQGDFGEGLSPRGFPVKDVLFPRLWVTFQYNLLALMPSGGWEVREFYGVEIGVLSERIILPLLVLALPGFAGVARYMRAQVLEVLDQDYVRIARAKGLAEFTVVSRHIARNALLPLATMMGFALVARGSRALR